MSFQKTDEKVLASQPPDYEYNKEIFCTTRGEIVELARQLSPRSLSRGGQHPIIEFSI